MLLACFIPFIILCFYCFPSVDDFSYANIAESYGYIGAQIHWYTTWTGRYFATAILSLSPVLIKNFTLYQLFSMAVLMGSVHSIYFVIRSLNANAAKWHAFLISLAATLSYLLFLPDITEAFYWFPGSVTYQLASVLATYLLGLGIRAESAQFVNVRVWITMSALAFVVVGSNEVVMVVTAMSVTLYYLFSLFQAKGIFSGRLMLLIATALGCAFMVFSPGNNVRAENNLAERNFNQLSEAFSHSYSDMTVFIGQYFWIPVLPLVILSMLYFAKPERTKVHWVHLLITVALLFTLIFSVIFPGYYIYKMAAPLRTQNFNLWILVFGTIVVGRILSPLVLAFKSFTPALRINVGSIGFYLYFCFLRI